MGLQAEFNWYVVCKRENVVHQEKDKTIFQKDGFRVYPMHTPLPLIYNGQCLALVEITRLEWENNVTVLHTNTVLAFEHGDPVAEYYEKSFAEYKRKQEMIDDGGKTDLRMLVNGEFRIRMGGLHEEGDQSTNFG